MRILVICLILGISCPSWSCSKPITISYAPFISLLVVERIFGNFHKKLETLTGCSVSFKLHRSFNEFAISLFKREAMLTFAPGPYYQVLKPLGYIAFANRGIATSDFTYVIASKKKNINSLEELANKRVLVMSPLSSSGSYFLYELDKRELSGKLDIQYDGSYDSMMVNVLRGDADAAVVIGYYWRILNENIKNNQIHLIESIPSPATTDVMILKEEQQLAPSVFAALKETDVVWEKHDGVSIGSPLLAKALKQMLDVYQSGEAEDFSSK